MQSLENSHIPENGKRNRLPIYTWGKKMQSTKTMNGITVTTQQYSTRIVTQVWWWWRKTQNSTWTEERINPQANKSMRQRRTHRKLAIPMKRENQRTPKHWNVEAFNSSRVMKLNRLFILIVDRPSARKRHFVERERVGVAVVVVFFPANRFPN